MSEEPRVLVERRGAAAILTFNRPDARNAIDDAMREAFSAALAEVSADDAVRAIVLTGAGSAFCAGGDVKAMQGRLAAGSGKVAFDGWRRQRRTADFVAALTESDRITIAAVNGAAVGLGLDLALACDFIVAAPEAKFASSFVRRGLIPDGGGMYFLPRRIGLQRTKELIYSGRTVAAEEALRLGLVDRLAPEGGLIDDTLAYAEQFTANSRPAIALMKSIVSRTFESPLDRIAALGGEAQAIAYTTEEHRAAVDAFLNR
ncbi:MAG: enoyl-CoA hydratase/isomerase family protein [Microbacteriaceae bacterium]|nr:enoyl-CoA hydratase/isomerase family protein [Microbacteriaceae bacterium]